MATRYDVSRTVIREVVRVLESLGLASVRRRVGITILDSEHWNSLDPNVIRWQLAGPDRFEQLSILSELRSGIEPLAARLAATRATPEQCGALTAARHRHVSYLSRLPIPTHISAMTPTFTAHCSPLPVTRCCGRCRRSSSRYSKARTRHSLMPHEADPEAIHLHGVVASAIQAGDADAAEAAMRSIVAESAEAVETMRESPEPPPHL